jgi:hypothetical protein
MHRPAAAWRLVVDIREGPANVNADRAGASDSFVSHRFSVEHRLVKMHRGGGAGKDVHMIQPGMRWRCACQSRAIAVPAIDDRWPTVQGQRLSTE